MRKPKSKKKVLVEDEETPPQYEVGGISLFPLLSFFPKSQNLHVPTSLQNQSPLKTMQVSSIVKTLHQAVGGKPQNTRLSIIFVNKRSADGAASVEKKTR
ncbi:hypothetical protein DY000_02041451 [Brassica cretica]|uniref:Uncharacterized protein n=1 Tax=Brassica cretica TaxID=69181 RepID=A0ABQ7BK46_BRACR|nr:hypothetical protein DY000_02041451 [Brassica cretica]